jgi:hypothetical protein
MVGLLGAMKRNAPLNPILFAWIQKARIGGFASKPHLTLRKEDKLPLSGIRAAPDNASLLAGASNLPHAIDYTLVPPSGNLHVVSNHSGIVNMPEK